MKDELHIAQRRAVLAHEFLQCSDLSGAVSSALGRVEAGIGLNELQQVTNLEEAFRYPIRDFNIELFFKRHQEFDCIEGIRPKVLDERGLRGHPVFADIKLHRDDLPNPFFQSIHR
jgi:hypothetical protein